MGRPIFGASCSSAHYKMIEGMEGVGVVNHGVSTWSLQGSDESPSNTKRLKIAAYESSDDGSSTSVVEDDNNGSTVDSLDAPEIKLLEMGCSSEQIAHAIEICGRCTDIVEIFDFIQATSYDTLNDVCTSKFPTLKVLEDDSNGSTVDSEITLLEMGCSSEQIARAIEICGRNTDISEIFDFIQATSYGILNEDCASKVPTLKVVEDDNHCFTVDSLDVLARKLLDMGCSSEQVAHAVKICGKNTDIDEMFDFIQATSYDALNEGCTSKVPTLQVDSFEHQKDIDLTTFQTLGKMGFSSSAINNAVKTCESLDLEDLVRFLFEAEEGNLPHGEDLQVEESGQKSQPYVDSFAHRKDIDLTTFQTLRKMGFSSSAINNAMETCESLDLEDLVSFLFEAEEDNLPHGEDLRVEESGQKSQPYEESLRAGSKVNYEAGPSRTVSPPVTWTRDKIKLWYTYLGLKQDFFSDPDAFGSANKKCRERSRGFKPWRGDVFVPEKMMGFSIPSFSLGRPRPLPEITAGPPYFYFENVAGAPKLEWETIRRHFHGVDVEYTDAKYFSATRRPRGYVHNIPIDNRKPIMPEPPMTIFEALPGTEEYWPHWDNRDKLNCINTRRAPDTLCEMIRNIFIEYEEIPYVRQQEILQACKRWNLVWVGPGQAAGLEPHEMELLLGFDKDHTRGRSSMTDRYTALGNSFQVNTVAYHLSPLKSLYPKGITVLSLFSGIGGAEVALHKSGIILKAVVAVESNVKASNAIAGWWKRTGQRGILKELHDVRDLTYEVLSGLIDELGKIDLIIGGSPCNNLSGCNRVSRVGLSGKESSLFFEFPRILNLVKIIMTEKGYL